MPSCRPNWDLNWDITAAHSPVQGFPRLLRLIRNLLKTPASYSTGDISLSWLNSVSAAASLAVITVHDRGPGAGRAAWS
jgi:signal transduction histidine kinase